MALYNCTPLGCVQNATGSYPDLLSCQAACLHWGCPPQLTIDTDIIFAYDGSGSYAQSHMSSRMDIFKAATAWTETLTQSGWIGTAEHTIMGGTSQLISQNAVSYGFPQFGVDGSYIQPYTGDELYCNVNGTVLPVPFYIAGKEEWLLWGSLPYIATNINPSTGLRDPDTNNPLMYNQGTTPQWQDEIPLSVQEQYFSIYKYRVGMDSNNASINTGATYTARPTLVVAFCHQSSYGIAQVPGVGSNHLPKFKAHYTLWDELYQNNPNPERMKAFLFPVKNVCEGEYPPHPWAGGGSWDTLQNTITQGILTILNGNQDDVAKWRYWYFRWYMDWL